MTYKKKNFVKHIKNLPQHLSEKFIGDNLSIIHIALRNSGLSIIGIAQGFFEVTAYRYRFSTERFIVPWSCPSLQLMLQTFHKILSSQQKVHMANMTLQGALKLFLATVASLVHLLENRLYTQSLGFHIFKGFYSILIWSEVAENEIRLNVSNFPHEISKAYLFHQQASEKDTKILLPTVFVKLIISAI